MQDGDITSSLLSCCSSTERTGAEEGGRSAAAIGDGHSVLEPHSLALYWNGRKGGAENGGSGFVCFGQALAMCMWRREADGVLLAAAATGEAGGDAPTEGVLAIIIGGGGGAWEGTGMGGAADYRHGWKCENVW